jgi:Ca2+/Na+ antiporter
MKIKQWILFGLILIVAGTLLYMINLNWWNILNLLILACAIVAVVWLLILLSRFVKAFERMAGVLEDAAHKFREGNKQ